MADVQNLFARNQAWAEGIKARDPEFFSKLAHQQSPEYLWIGCADSRVPATEIVDLMPGEIFVHRNVANAVVHTDLNCLSVMQFAVEVLAVKHILVVGHYGCGGVAAALGSRRLGLIDNWLRHIQDVRLKHAAHLDGIEDLGSRVNRLCELNVIEQVNNVCLTTVVQDAWDRGQDLAVHGWIYALEDGIIRDLHINVTSQADLSVAYEQALRTLPGIPGQIPKTPRYQ